MAKENIPMKLKFLLLLLGGLASQCIAQKLPNTQPTSLHAPANIKIDGKPTEWGNVYEAYNKATGIYYSMANDDENLYLVIYSDNFDITTKILTNGINISFNAEKKSKEKSQLVKYPIGPATWKENGERGNLIMSKLTNNGGSLAEDLRKTARLNMNRAIVTLNKHVRIFGVNALTDTLFSIYDAQGVKVNMECPGHNLLCYELSVPLKYLQIKQADLPKLYYNIRLNESFMTHFAVGATYKGKMPGGNDEGTVMLATDFWGEYTLAK